MVQGQGLVSRRTRTCKLVLEDKTFLDDNNTGLQLRMAYLVISDNSKPFFSVSSCTVVGTEFMDHMIMHNRVRSH